MLLCWVVERTFAGERIALLGWMVSLTLLSSASGIGEISATLATARSRRRGTAQILEEAGFKAGEVRYVLSQPWPFPALLMLGFEGIGLTNEIVLDTKETRAARWFTCAELHNRKAAGFNLPPGDSIARRLIEDWLAMRPSGR